jgi:hypothetical protein
MAAVVPAAAIPAPMAAVIAAPMALAKMRIPGTPATADLDDNHVQGQWPENNGGIEAADLDVLRPWTFRFTGYINAKQFGVVLRMPALQEQRDDANKDRVIKAVIDKFQEKHPLEISLGFLKTNLFNAAAFLAAQ